MVHLAFSRDDRFAKTVVRIDDDPVHIPVDRINGERHAGRLALNLALDDHSHPYAGLPESLAISVENRAILP